MQSLVAQWTELWAPIDELKIDKSFVQALGVDRRARAIVSSAIELARALDLTLVAEGIETSANFKILEEIGADIGQGWAIARSTSFSPHADMFKALLSRERSEGIDSLRPVQSSRL